LGEFIPEEVVNHFLT